jgi:hypothetical protein
MRNKLSDEARSRRAGDLAFWGVMVALAIWFVTVGMWWYGLGMMGFLVALRYLLGRKRLKMRRDNAGSLNNGNGE